jgi:hypothetical protein
VEEGWLVSGILFSGICFIIKLKWDCVCLYVYCSFVVFSHRDCVCKNNITLGGSPTNFNKILVLGYI